jgi:hypothetical protein
MPLGEKILLVLAKRLDQPEWGATERYTLENCLAFVRMTVPGFKSMAFKSMVAAKTGLDYSVATPGREWRLDS